MEIYPEPRWFAVAGRRKEDNFSSIEKPSEHQKAKEGFLILVLFFLLLFASALAEEQDKAAFGEMNIRLMFSREIEAGSFLYAPKKGETLYDISRKFNMTPELLKEINAVSEGEELPGELKIVPGNFSITIEREKNILILYREGKFFKEYSVATGRDLSTPLGEYTIASKLIKPPWIWKGEVITADDEDYPLGTRWMGLSSTRIGIHGTKDPQYIGEYVSSGCIRMHNSDIEELFKIVPFGTKVIIKE